jgi:hypothetical protein
MVHQCCQQLRPYYLNDRMINEDWTGKMREEEAVV